MDHNARVKPPIWFWIISIIALVWNLMGVMAYMMDVTASADAIAALTDLQREQRADRPAWYIAAFAIAVFSATLGAISLLIRKRWALSLFAVSLVGVLLQQLYHFVLSDIGKALNSADLIMTIMIPIVAILLLFFTRHATSKSWLG